jgi:hypothetical protein
MAAVGLGAVEAAARVPNGVIVACHNASDSVTISGEADAVARMMDDLRADDVFVRKVESNGVAFHSPQMSAVSSCGDNGWVDPGHNAGARKHAVRFRSRHPVAAPAHIAMGVDFGGRRRRPVGGGQKMLGRVSRKQCHESSAIS